MNKRWVFDLDDTVVHCQLYYSWALVQFMEYILNKFGFAAPPIEEIMQLRRKLDEELLNEMGFTLERFPRSFEVTLLQVAEDVKQIGYDIEISETDIQDVKDIACTAFNPQPCLIEDAVEALQYLRAQGDILILYTKGEQELQQDKAVNNALRKYFDDVIVVKEKDRKTLEKKIGKPAPNTRIIGDSLDSDIIPGLEAGFKTIYIPSVSEIYRPLPEEVANHPNFRVLKGIRTLKESYDEL